MNATSHARRAILVAAGLVCSGAVPAWPFANPTTGIFINEIHYDNASTDTGEAIEIAGPAGTDLTGWSLVLYNGSGGAVYDTTALSGTIPDQQGGFGTVFVSYPTNGIQNGAPDGIALVDASSMVVQFLSYEGVFTAVGGPADGILSTDIGVSESGSEATGLSLQLLGSGSTYGDFTWNTPAASTFGSVNTGQSFNAGDGAPVVSGTSPANGAPAVAVDADISVTFSEAVDVSGAWFDITCSGSGAHTATVSGGPTTFTLDPDVDFASGDTCTVSIFAAQVSDQDTDDPPDNMAADFDWSFGTNPCGLAYTPAYSIQGSGLAAAITGPVTTQGVVVGDYEGPSPTLRGFYVQDPAGDADPATSDAVFVFNGDNDDVDLGDVVRVTGTAGEFQDQTQIGSVTAIVKCGTDTVSPVDVMLPVLSATDLERYEGMLVRLPQTLYVTETFHLGRFGQVVVSSGGRLAQPTNVVAPGAPALALQAANDLNRIIVDDDLQNQNPDPIVFGRNGNPLSASNTLRGGDTVTGIVGVMTYTWAGNAASGNAYRVRPINALSGHVDFQPANSRPALAPSVGGRLRVVGMNLLNFFNTFGTGACTNGVGGSATDCRGADDAVEFGRQWPKTVAAILSMDADVIGMNELENDGYGPTSALQFLVDSLNAATAPGTYAFVDVDAATGQVDAMGNDAIRVALLYQPAAVTPVGQTGALNSVAFINGGDSAPRNRAALAQAFQENATGAVFVVGVTHLKSKGSACDVPDAGDGQGNCNVVRVNAVAELLNWFASDPTGTGDPDMLMIGDFNSYAMEDPIMVMESGGFTNLIASWIGPGAYSYVFDGQWGALEHALGSASIVSQVTGVGVHHINADEPGVLDYNTNFKSPAQEISLYASDEFRTSDHDPVVVGLSPTPEATSLEITGTFYDDDGAPTLLAAKLSGAGACDVGGKTVKFYVDLDGDGNFTDTPDELVGTGGTSASGIAQYSWDSSSIPAWVTGIWEVRAVFDGAPNCLASDDTTTISIVQRGDAANGGGWYQYKTTGSPRVNEGFTVGKQKDGSYTGQVVWHNNGKWRIRGTLTTFGKTAPCTYAGKGGLRCGSSLGRGKLQRWNGSTLIWEWVQDVSYVINFVDGGSSKKLGAKSDYFGINVTNFSDPSLPESAPQQLKGGNVFVL